MNTCDVFLCYRDRGGQTAKLFSRYLASKSFPATVWYSDDESVGNYRDDIPDLVGSAKCAVLFIDNDFTAGFLDEDAEDDCITALEVTEIARRIQECGQAADEDSKDVQDTDEFNIVTVFLDRPLGLKHTETRVLKELFEAGGVPDSAEAARKFAQSNGNVFHTRRDYEDELFAKLAGQMMPNSFYQSRVISRRGRFGALESTAEYVVWGGTKGIAPRNVVFEGAPNVPELYRKVDRERVALEYEIQNNTMVSVVGTDVVLQDGTEDMLLTVRYLPIEYLLFYKLVNLPKPQRNKLRIDAAIASYNPELGDDYVVPNAMGLAFMVVTADDKLVFTRRSRRRGVRPGEYDCSIVEGLLPNSVDMDGNEYDLMDECYLENEIRRAFREEMCNADCLDDIFVSGVVLDCEYGQWNFIGVMRTTLAAADIEMIHGTREDTYEDNQLIFVPFTNEVGELDLSEVERSLSLFMTEGFWGMGLAVTWAALSRVGFGDVELLEMSKRLAERR